MIFLKLVKRFWQEYEAHFPGQFAQDGLGIICDLGRDVIGIELQNSDGVESFVIYGSGFDPLYHLHGRGYSRVNIILSNLGQYDIKGKIIMERW